MRRRDDGGGQVGRVAAGPPRIDRRARVGADGIRGSEVRDLPCGAVRVGIPRTHQQPAAGRPSSAPIRFNNVGLPLPDGAMKETNAARSIAKVTSFSAPTETNPFVYVFVRSLATIRLMCARAPEAAQDAVGPVTAVHRQEWYRRLGPCGL